ncbi:hypothetical protein IX293_002157 [Fusobacterium necrophorum]|nr:hypothetical protein [Fusobacterium necrophorum]MBR8823882.1 hypothetical protein [Fusobacterium necrophorum]
MNCSRNVNVWESREEVLVYRAGKVGVLLVKESIANEKFSYIAISFIGDDFRKIGNYIYDIKLRSKDGDRGKENF